MKTRKGIYNLLFGLASQLVAIAFGILLPRLLLKSFGSEMNGLLSSISQIFVYIGLLEAGVGTVTVLSLYNPIAKNDRNAANEILSATNKYYRRTGIYYFLVVLAFAIIYPFVVVSNIDRITVIAVILLNGMGGVINFFFQGKFRLLLQAEGKTYILTNLGTVTNVLTSLLRIYFLTMGYNIILIQSIYLFFNLIQMIYISLYIKKHYDWIDLSVKPNYEAISQKNSVLLHQISSLIFQNTDVLILTFFTNLKVVSVYAMYKLLFNMITMMTNTITNSVSFVLGQEFNANRKRYIVLHDIFENYYLALVFALYCIAYIFILPFMKLYTAGIVDINYLDKYIPMLFVTINLLSESRITSQVISFAKHFKETQNRSFLESIINLVSSLVLVQFYGIYGVLAGTILALSYRTNDMIIYSNRRILARSPWVTYRKLILNLGLFLLVVLTNSLVTIDLTTYPRIIGWAAIYSFVVIPVFFLANSIMEKEIYQNTRNLIAPMMAKIGPKIKQFFNPVAQ